MPLGQVVWGSLATAVATVNSGGLATCVQFGSSIITATSGNFSSAASLSCSPAADFQGPASAVDLGSRNNNDGQQLCTAGDCASTADTPGIWTTTTAP